MIDYDKPDHDPVVAEVRRVREEIAARFNYDLRAIFDDMQHQQENSGQKYVSLSPRRPEMHSPVPKKAG